MSAADISFPNLGIIFHNVPKTFSIFGFEIAMYGIVIGIAVLAGFAMALKQAKLDGQDPDTYWDFVVYAIIFSIIGARIYYVVFAWDMYKDDLWEVFNIRNGGLAIYGAVIGAFLTCFVFCKIKKKRFFDITDVGVTGLILGQIIGRWANFFNREAFGDFTNNLLAMYLPVTQVRSGDMTQKLAQNIVTVDGIECISVHPTFLYESVLNLIVLLFMLVYRKHKKFKGEMTLLYLGGYGIVRFFVEGLRTDQLKWFGTDIAVSQVFGITLFLVAVGAEIIIRLELHKKELLRKMQEEPEQETEDTKSEDTKTEDVKTEDMKTDKPEE